MALVVKNLPANAGDVRDKRRKKLYTERSGKNWLPCVIIGF